MEGTSPQWATFEAFATATKQLCNVSRLLANHFLSGCDIIAHKCGIDKARVVKQLLKGIKLGRIGNVEDDITVKEAQRLLLRVMEWNHRIKCQKCDMNHGWTKHPSRKWPELRH